MHAVYAAAWPNDRFTARRRPKTIRDRRAPPASSRIQTSCLITKREHNVYTNEKSCPSATAPESAELRLVSPRTIVVVSSKRTVPPACFLVSDHTTLYFSRPVMFTHYTHHNDRTQYVRIRNYRRARKIRKSPKEEFKHVYIMIRSNTYHNRYTFPGER